MVKALTPQRPSAAATRADRWGGVLEMAVRRHVRIDLELASDIQPVFAQATILTLAGSVLTLQLSDGVNRNRLLAQTGPLRARFTVDGRCFEFDATPADDPVVARENLLALRRPTALRSVERRRVARRRLQTSSQVVIRPDGAGNVVDAGLLNLSDFGLACRIARRDAEPLRTGTPVRAGFSLNEAVEAFDLSARVVNLTPASDGKWIAGLEFDRTESNAAELTRLRSALGAPTTASSTDEGTPQASGASKSTPAGTSAPRIHPEREISL